jgi:hypothetical protein
MGAVLIIGRVVLSQTRGRAVSAQAISSDNAEPVLAQPLAAAGHD